MLWNILHAAGQRASDTPLDVLQIGQQSLSTLLASKDQELATIWEQQSSALVQSKQLRYRSFAQNTNSQLLTVILNDTVAYLDWSQDVFYGTELYNQAIAEQQRLLLKNNNT